MLYRILAVGDVVGQSGVQFLKKHLRAAQKLYGVNFTVVNGENAQMTTARISCAPPTSVSACPGAATACSAAAASRSAS